jgi:hypothetical protein
MVRHLMIIPRTHNYKKIMMKKIILIFEIYYDVSYHPAIFQIEIQLLYGGKKDKLCSNFIF